MGALNTNIDDVKLLPTTLKEVLNVTIHPINGIDMDYLNKKLLLPEYKSKSLYQGYASHIRTWIGWRLRNLEPNDFLNIDILIRMIGSPDVVGMSCREVNKRRCPKYLALTFFARNENKLNEMRPLFELRIVQHWHDESILDIISQYFYSLRTPKYNPFVKTKYRKTFIKI